MDELNFNYIDENIKNYIGDENRKFTDIIGEEYNKIQSDVKGDTIETAKIAGTMAVKNTWNNIPYCHQVPLSSIDFNFEINEDNIVAYCYVKAIYKTGVEMETINGVLTSLLTIWDMVKYLEKDETGNYPETGISDVRVLYKRKVSLNAPS